MIKALGVFLILFSSFFARCQNNNKTADFKKMEWLIGTWKGETNGQPFYETWQKLSETEFNNVNYSICNGDTIRGGHSKIEIRNGKIAYTSNNLAWNLKELNDSLIIFESEQYGEKFTFTKTKKGEWKAHLKYPRSQVEYLLSKTFSISELLKTKPAPITGYYEGYLEFMDKKLKTSINFEYSNGKQIATASTPDNLQLNMPFNEVCYNPPFLKLMLRDGTKNLELNAKLANNRISGKLAGEIPANILLQKVDSPNKSNDYSIVPLEIRNGNIKLPANLFLPNSDKPTGAVIIVCGTGQRTKEEYNGWAELLASKGVAVLTYDKRNVTNFPNLNVRQRSSDIVLPGELESDLQSAFELIKKRKEINPKKIGLLGFSQGAVVVPVVAANNPDIAFVAAISGNTTTDKVFIIDQAVNKLKSRNVDKDLIARTEKILDSLFQYVKDRKKGNDLQKQLDNAYGAGYGQYALPRHLPNEDEIKYLSTWNSFEHDPSKYWRKLSVPCYIVYGDKDSLIPVEQSVVILNDIFSKNQSLLTLKVYAGADHFIKTIPNRNDFDFQKFADGYIEDLTNWLIQRTK